MPPQSISFNIPTENPILIQIQPCMFNCGQKAGYRSFSIFFGGDKANPNPLSSGKVILPTPPRYARCTRIQSYSFVVGIHNPIPKLPRWLPDILPELYALIFCFGSQKIFGISSHEVMYAPRVMIILPRFLLGLS